LRDTKGSRPDILLQEAEEGAEGVKSTKGNSEQKRGKRKRKGAKRSTIREADPKNVENEEPLKHLVRGRVFLWF